MIANTPILPRWHRRELAAACAYLALFVMLDWTSYVQPVLKLGITPWNPQAGLTLAVLLLFGPRWLPITALAVLMSEVLVRQGSPVSGLVLGYAVWVAAGYGVLATVLRRLGLATPIRDSRSAAKFAGVTAAGTLLIAAGYVALFIAAGLLARAHSPNSLPSLWIGDLTGILTLTPVLIYGHEWAAGLRLLRRRIWEGLAQLLALLLTLWIAFGLSATNQLHLFYPLFVPVIWIALRWGVAGSILSTLLIQIGLIVGAQEQSNAPPLLDLQFLMLTLSLTAFLLGAVVTERAAAATDRQRAEARLRERDTALARAMRFAVAGELASALAHELNQPITALVSYLRASEIMATAGRTGDERLAETLKKAVQEAIRASEVLRRLRNFYQGNAGKRRPVNLSSLCEAASVSFRDRLQRAGARLVTRVDVSLPRVSADATQIEIVLHNLLSNAIDAVMHVPADRRLIEVAGNQVGNSILLRVEDSGPGLAEDIADRLFEPFMTSKPDGMGLGLAISRSLLRAGGGELSFDKSRHGGAAFIVRLPIGSEQANAHE
ncbi:MAG: MASE1 domain-containing protein [Proteobacteria bacterium]|nr:MASE1 domain-containing protein [Pseudomonadota bacterium]